MVVFGYTVFCHHSPSTCIVLLIASNQEPHNYYKGISSAKIGCAGFTTAKVLSRKMVQLYKLASQQLSQQEHYDFGMRALKSVLATAGSLKRASPGNNHSPTMPLTEFSYLKLVLLWSHIVAYGWRESAFIHLASLYSTPAESEWSVLLIPVCHEVCQYCEHTLPA